MSIFKESFKGSIRGELLKRQQALVKRSPNTIQYLNSRNAWVRMTSSVNVTGKKNLAANYILFGGTKGGIDKNPLKSGIGENTTNAYSTKSPGGRSNKLGIRPMPGITSVDVRSAGAYGSLRLVTVNFTAWDISQLEDLEKLYMRPGYSVLVEWGWSPYLDSKGNLVTTVPSCDIINKTPSQEQIYKEIFAKVESSGGNYDAAFGKVQNYSWKARSDGGYDCSTTIITIGEVLESIKINYTPTKAVEYEKNLMFTNRPPTFNTAIVNESYSRNIMVGICQEFRAQTEATPPEGGGISGIVSVLDKNTNQKYHLYRAQLTEINTNNPSPDANQTTIETYIALKSLIQVINNYVLIAPTNNSSFVKVSVNSSTLTSDGTPLLCIADPIQLSTDPSVCILPNAEWSNPANIGINNLPSDNFIGCFATNATPEGLSYLNPDKFGIIGNIFINLDYIISLVTDENLAHQDKKEKQEISLYNFLKSMMAGINNAIGNLANFDIHVEPYDGNVARIIDLHYTGKKSAIESAFNFEIQRATNEDSGASIVRNYSLESKIFSEQSTMFAIASQVKSTGALETENNTLVSYNNGITDRIIPSKEATTDIGLTDDQKAAAYTANLNLITSFVSKLGGCSAIGDLRLIGIIGSTYDVAESYKYANSLRDIINYRRSLRLGNSEYDRAIIPTSLTLEIDGIGGIVIGNLFKIPYDQLPTIYRGTTTRKIGYLVVRLGHNISNGDWVTKIESQFTILEQNENS